MSLLRGLCQSARTSEGLVKENSNTFPETNTRDTIWSMHYVWLWVLRTRWIRWIRLNFAKTFFLVLALRILACMRGGRGEDQRGLRTNLDYYLVRLPTQSKGNMQVLRGVSSSSPLCKQYRVRKWCTYIGDCNTWTAWICSYIYILFKSFRGFYMPLPNHFTAFTVVASVGMLRDKTFHHEDTRGAPVEDISSLWTKIWPQP